MAHALSVSRGPAARSYRLPWHVILIGDLDARTRRSFAVSGVLGLLVLTVVGLAPAPVVELPSVKAMPQRLARLLLADERPKAAAPAPRATATPTEAHRPGTEAPARKAAETPAPPVAAPPGTAPVEHGPRRLERAGEPPRLSPQQGQIGRGEAEAATAALASTSKTLDATLARLSSALPAAGAEVPAAPPTVSRGRLRRGRGQEGLGEVPSGVPAAAPDGGGSVLLAAGISLDIGDPGRGGGQGESAFGAVGGGGAQGGEVAAGFGALSGGGPKGAAGGGPIRSDASLLAVLQRYAPGIRFCYENALKGDAGLDGKLVLRLTVEADGSVSGVSVLEDDLGSAEVKDCVLAQVRAWRFGAVPAGQVSFRAPFVFTPVD